MPAQHVRGRLLQAEPLPADDFDQLGKAVVVEDALPGLALVEILHVEDALQIGLSRVVSRSASVTNWPSLPSAGGCG